MDEHESDVYHASFGTEPSWGTNTVSAGPGSIDVYDLGITIMRLLRREIVRSWDGANVFAVLGLGVEK